MQTQLSQVNAPKDQIAPSHPSVVAALFQANGFTADAGSLAHEIMTRAGLSNLAVERQIAGYSYLPLEVLISARPDLLIISRSQHQLPSIAEELLSHPALLSAFAGPSKVHIPAQVWTCGTANAAEAVVRLRNAAKNISAARTTSSSTPSAFTPTTFTPTSFTPITWAHTR